MDSGNLSEFYNDKFTIKEQVLGSVAARILKALNYLHRAKGLAYRDLKPRNILIHSDGAIKLADFDTIGDLGLKVSDNPDLFPHYMSPERLDGEPTDSPSCDIWSLGLCMLEGATGRYPYSIGPGDLDNQALIARIVNDRPPEAPKTLSTNFKDFIAKCLNKTPKQRPTAKKLLKHPFVLASEDFAADKVLKFLNYFKQMSRYLAAKK